MEVVEVSSHLSGWPVVGRSAPLDPSAPPEHVAELIAWPAASPPEFVLTEGIVLSIEEGLP
jgi:hypothetical protein